MNDRQYADPDTGELVTDTRQNVRHLPPARPAPPPVDTPSLPMHSASITELTKALVVAQAEFKPIKRDAPAKITDTRSYLYAPLETIIAATKEGLTKAGLVISQTTHPAPRGAVLVTMLQHTSGEWKASYWPLSAVGKPQDQGSELTYARRYQRCAILDIQPEDADDDGAAASKEQMKRETRTQPQATRPAQQPSARAVAKQQTDKEAAAFVDGMSKDAEEHLGKDPSSLPEGVYEYFGIPTEVTHKDTAKGGKAFRVHFNDPNSDGVEWFGTFDTEVAATCEASVGKARLRLLYEKTKFGKKIMEIFPA